MRTLVLHLCLANCYFAHDSSGFPVLLLFFDAQSGRSCYPLDRHAGPVARTWWRPFPRCRVPSSQTPAPDRKSLPPTIAQSILVGPHPCRLDGALGPSYSSSPFRNRSEAFYPASPSQSHEQAKVPVSGELLFGPRFLIPTYGTTYYRAEFFARIDKPCRLSENVRKGCSVPASAWTLVDKSYFTGLWKGCPSSVVFAIHGVFTPVLAKHSNSFLLSDCISVGVD